LFFFVGGEVTPRGTKKEKKRRKKKYSFLFFPLTVLGKGKREGKGK